jgi:hypothetical protein
VTGQRQIGAVERLDQLHRQARLVFAAQQAQREVAIGREPHRRRIGIVEVRGVVVGILATRQVVDRRVGREVERPPLGVEPGPHRADLLEADLEERRDPRPGRGDVDAIAIPDLEVEAALDLGRRGQGQELAGLVEADVLDEAVEGRRRQRRHEGRGVGIGEQRLDPRAAARARELGAQASERSVGFGHVGPR